MVKEDRSGWVAVAPEFSSSGASGPNQQIRPAASAYQFFQKDVTPQVKREMSGMAFDVGTFSKRVRDRWNNLDDERRSHYEAMARDDKARFARESHNADVQQIERQRQLQEEREQLILTNDDGRSSTRGTRKRELKKQERRAKKKLAKQKARSNDDSDSDFQEDEESEASYESEDDDSSEDDQPKRKKKPPPPPPRKVSQAALARRERVRAAKEEKEDYIVQRQGQLQKDRAAQAKRRLEFLLKQSDIFSHFGKVKEDQAKYGIKVSSSRRSEGGSRRRGDDAADDEVDEAELNEADEHDATYLTAQPKTLGFGKMRPYQLEGLNWMIRLQENGVNGILADEMGLGKTLQSISVLVYMREFQNNNGPHLVVVPKSTLSNWMSEIERWAPELTAVKFHGKKEEREHITKTIMEPAQRDENRTWDVCVTTYEVCNIDKQVFNKFAWSYLIIDEAHRLKNETSTFSRTIRTFETRYRLLLTGTPLQNNLHELWALLNFLVPDVFASAEQFDEWFNLDIDDANEKNKLIKQLHKILRPFMLRRLKADVEKTLPPKHETILFTGMSEMQKKLYRDILLRDFDALQGSNSSGSRTALLNIVMQLRKCAGHPYLFPGVEDRTLPPLGEHLINHCGKMVLLDKLLRRLKERGHRVLLFTQMTRMLDIIEDYLVMRQFQYCRIDGNTSYEQREEYIDNYNAENSSTFIFLLSTRAGGLGINLQTADVVILYDSDWNPQADLQAQDRAHRIGQKREVQVFRFVTEHTIEEKIVERAQQKLKLDAMVVQQGRLKEKDKLSRDELLEAVRFGADKIFKSKDSSITDDDIDLILDAGKRKTQELNEKLQKAEKGDLLDFKLDGGGLSTQTFEGVDYAKAAQAQAELLGIMDIGKRERRTVANYNENQLYQRQIAALQGPKRPKKKAPKLPKNLRLPRMEEWHMYQRTALLKIQEEEEAAFKNLPEEQQKMAHAAVTGRKGDDNEKETEPFVLPPLISDEQQTQKKELLAEGFSDWGRQHYTAFIRASSKYGRTQLENIAIEVGKPLADVDKYARAFWDENYGKVRFSETEYDRVVKLIEKGEKKIAEVKALEKSALSFVLLFDDPWRELEFTFVNCKDKMFTIDEDRFLLCWACKFGYGQWDAIKMAIRRSPQFRFDYLLRSLPTEAIGRRCDQLMKAAEKEVEQLEKKAREDAGLPVEEEKKDANGESKPLAPVKIPRFKEMRAQMRLKAKQEADKQMTELETKVEEIEEQVRRAQERLKVVSDFTKEASSASGLSTAEFPGSLLGDLANLVATCGSVGIVSIANKFEASHPRQAAKRTICAKIEEIAVKEQRKDETKPLWYVRDAFTYLLEADTLKQLRQRKEDTGDVTSGTEDGGNGHLLSGAPGPDGTMVDFPEYDGAEPPRECKKAFTHFCNGTRKEVKASLPPEERRDKHTVNGILKERWFSISDEDKKTWKAWEEWDVKRFARDTAIHQNAKRAIKKKRLSEPKSPQKGNQIHVPKKKKMS